jgi:hypothetical protein
MDNSLTAMNINICGKLTDSYEYTYACNSLTDTKTIHNPPTAMKYKHMLKTERQLYSYNSVKVKLTRPF